MNKEMTEQLAATADRLAGATEALNRVLDRLDAQQEALNAKVDRIVAAVEEQLNNTNDQTQDGMQTLRSRVTELEKTNEELKAQATRLARKTLPSLVTTLLTKNTDGGDNLNAAALDKTLQTLSVEQRIAVKAEMARAGMIE